MMVMKTSVAEKEVHFFENADDFRTATTILSGEKKSDSLLGKIDLLRVGNIELRFSLTAASKCESKSKTKTKSQRIEKQNEDEESKKKKTKNN